MNPAQVADLIAGALGACLIAGPVAVACTACAIRALRLQRNAGARFTLWFAALIGLSLAVPAFLAGEYRAIEQTPAVRLSALPQPFSVIALHHMPSAAAAPSAHITTPQPAAPTDSLAIVVFGWLGGTTLSLLRIALGFLKLQRIRARATIIGARNMARGKVAILNADAFSVPVALGYRHPAIVLPSSVLQLEGAADVEQVLLHEMEHLRRFDDVTSLLQAICVSILWFNPFAYYIARCASIEREMACDEAVVARTGMRIRYATTLWKLAGSASDTLVPAVSTAFFSGRHAVARMNNLLDPQTGRPVRVPAKSLAIASCVLLIGGAMAVPPVLGAGPSIQNYAMVRLPGGDYLAIGGERAGKAVPTAQLFEPDGGRIAVIAMRVPRWSASATVLPNGNVVVLGGMTYAGVTNQAELYVTARRAFCPLGPLKAARAGHSATLLRDGRVLVASGERAPGSYVATTELYDPQTGTSAITADGAARVFATAVLIDKGSVLLFGGSMTRGRMKCAIIYDPVRRAYRDAGDFVGSDARTISFRLPNGGIVTHYLTGA